jgi:hypothetical protein
VRAEARAKGYEREACGECGNGARVAQRHLFEVRYVRVNDRVFVK